MRRIALGLALALLVGCGDDALTKGEAPPGNCAPVSEGLDVQPAVLQRGAPVDIRIEWRIAGEVEPPAIATLRVGDAGAIEVELPLSLEPGSSGRWLGTQHNPFGLGTPAGYVSVLARVAGPFGCDEPATATAWFTLE